MAVFMPPPDATGSIVDLQNRLIEQFNPQTCPSFDDAQRLAEQALIDDWTVTVSRPPTNQRPCPSLAFDHTTRQILLVPIDRTDQ